MSSSWIQPFAVGCVATLLAHRAYSTFRGHSSNVPITSDQSQTTTTTTPNKTSSTVDNSQNVQTAAWVTDAESKAKQAGVVLPPGKVWGRRGEIENEKLTVEDWDTRWSKGHIGWHRNDVTPQLKKYIQTLRPTTSGRPRRILVPLCGKTVDMIWLVDQGFQVIGIEYSVKGIIDFAREQRINTYKVTQIHSDIVRYDMLDGKLIILQCDIFSPNLNYICIDGFVDFIWDRNAFNAIHPTLRQDYMDVLLKLLRPHDKTLPTYQDAKGTGVEQKEIQRPGPNDTYDFLLHVHDYDEKATSATPYPCPAYSIYRSLSHAATAIHTLDITDVSHEAHLVNSTWWHHVLYGIRLR